MFPKVLACLLIVVGCTYIGMVFAARSKTRVIQLGEFKKALNRLEFDIDFLNVTLEESFGKIADNEESVISRIFSYVGKALRENRCSDMGALWQRTIRKYREELFLTDEEIKIIIDFSKNLGSGDREKEKNNIKLTQMRLSIAEDEAREEEKKNAGMYRGLGALSGIFIVIVLV